MVHTNSFPRKFLPTIGLATLASASKRSLVILVVSLVASTVWSADDSKPKRTSGGNQKKVRAKFDANKDGRLGRAEQARLKEAMAKRRQGSGNQNADRRERMKRFDKDGDGRLNNKERQAAMKALGGSASDKRPDGTAAGRARNRGEFMKRFDKNGDGKIDETERKAMRTAFAKRNGNGSNSDRPNTDRPGAGFMKRFDKNGDGKLDETERKVARAAFADRQGATDRAPSATKPDTGRVSKKGLLKKFDTDGDGKLTGGERAAARRAFEKRQPKAAKK